MCVSAWGPPVGGKTVRCHLLVPCSATGLTASGLIPALPPDGRKKRLRAPGRGQTWQKEW